MIHGVVKRSGSGQQVLECRRRAIAQSSRQALPVVDAFKGFIEARLRLLTGLTTDGCETVWWIGMPSENR
ncbi:MAG: hypothetical protein ACLQUY_22285 [Ktedonobacterales bacterium]